MLLILRLFCIFRSSVILHHVFFMFCCPIEVEVGPILTVVVFSSVSVVEEYGWGFTNNWNHWRDDFAQGWRV